MSKYVFFTDLDGTLLDHHTYSYAPARPALSRLRATRTPLVMVSSKTRTEMEALRTDLDNRDPFIPENGAAIFVPGGYDLPLFDNPVTIGAYRVLLLGRRASEIAEAFDILASGLPVRALSHMSTAEVADLTGLSLDQAEAAKTREFGEAFVLDDPDIKEQDLERQVKRLGLRLTRGGRFWHLLGENDKGRAVSLLANLFRERHPDLITAACGDAPNDAPMLAVVDRPFLVARPDGSHQALDLPGLTRVALSGPAGFNQAVLSLLGQ